MEKLWLLRRARLRRKWDSVSLAGVLHKPRLLPLALTFMLSLALILGSGCTGQNKKPDQTKSLQPVQPEQPGQPVQPPQTGQNNQSGQHAQPPQTGQSGQSAQPTQPGQPAKPVQPGQQQGKAGKTPVSFTVLALSAAPQGLRDLAGQNREKATATGIELEGNVYLLVTRGVKPTGGYNVEITSVTQETRAGRTVIVATVKYTDPKPGQMVTQVITYPMTAAKLNLKAIPHGLGFVFIPGTR